MQARINSILRENELLKHQLKKYVGAVQKLRDGPQAHETLAQLEGNYYVPICKLSTMIYNKVFVSCSSHGFPDSHFFMIVPNSEVTENNSKKIS